MGFWSSSTPSNSPPAPKLAEDGNPIAPDRSQRSRCWEHRDIYFACLDKSNIVDSIREKDAALQKCGVESAEFEKNCATSWVQYFKKRRVMEYQKNQTLEKLKLEGAQELPPGVGPIPPSGPR